MDQEEKMDFKALRAKFQDEELLLKQPKIKPALPEKPKVVPPPQSPTHYLPAGARPSLLTSINQTLEAKTMAAPRVVFKDEKKESKKPLLQISSKKDKSEGKLKKGKEKTTKGSKEKLNDDSSEQILKKFPLVLPGLAKESTAELVPATPPPKSTVSKKGFLGFRKSNKRDSAEIPPDPILDTSSSDISGIAPLIPVPCDFGDALPEPERSVPKALLPNIPTLPDFPPEVEITPPSTTPASPAFTPPPTFIPDIPATNVPIPEIESETQLETETPALPVSRPDSQNDIIPTPPRAVATPPPSLAISGLPPVASFSPSPPEVEAAAEAVSIAAVEKPLPPVSDPPSIQSSPKVARPVSALSALERAEDMSVAKRTSYDQRIFNALEKARRKASSPLTNTTSSSSITPSVTPPPEELPPPQSPTTSLPELPPIDYEAGNAVPKPAQVNGFDHRQASPVLEGITEGAPDLLVVPPPPPLKKVLPHPESLSPAPEKPERPPSVSLSDFIPPHNEILAPAGFSETTDVPEFDDVASDAYSPELPVSDWGSVEYTGPDTPDGQMNLPDFYSNGIATPVADVQPESSLLTTPDYSPQAGLQGEVYNGASEITDNAYEDISPSASKKKGKTDAGKKRKGPPKNALKLEASFANSHKTAVPSTDPYAESQQVPNEEKIKTGRFGKADKKTAAEGPDEKELKKREKQRLEKEKKELKEKQEREKKEQKEREKKENEMKKKFKITGQEDAMYEAKVTVTTKGRKNDLPVKSGDNISIIRTTNCPKGKWLAKDSSNNYGYVAVDHMELDIKEMLELGKKAANTHKSSSSAVEADASSTGSRASNHYPLSAESFTDDSEEWTGDDDEPQSPPLQTADPLAQVGHSRTLSMPDMGNKDLSIIHQHSHSDISTGGSQARHEALHKLATFFHSKNSVEPAASITEPETSPVLVKEEAIHVPDVNPTQEMDFDQSDMPILPPPDLYA